MLIDEFAQRFVTKFRESFVDAGVFSDADQRAAAQQIAQAVRRNLNITEVYDVVGMGGFGMAARIKGTIEQVIAMLKLTTDESEVRASRAIRGEELPNVAKVYESVFVGGLPPGVTVGVVVNERMDDLGTGDRAIDRLLDSIVAGLHLQYELSLAMTDPNDPRYRATLDQASLSLMERLRAMHQRELNDVADGIEQLRVYGVYVIDAHTGNVGSRIVNVKHLFTSAHPERGPIKLFDLGLSSSPQKHVPSIEETSADERRTHKQECVETIDIDGTRLTMQIVRGDASTSHVYAWTKAEGTPSLQAVERVLLSLEPTDARGDTRTRLHFWWRRRLTDEEVESFAKFVDGTRTTRREGS